MNYKNTVEYDSEDIKQMATAEFWGHYDTPPGYHIEVKAYGRVEIDVVKNAVEQAPPGADADAGEALSDTLARYALAGDVAKMAITEFESVAAFHISEDLLYLIAAVLHSTLVDWRGLEQRPLPAAVLGNASLKKRLMEKGAILFTPDKAEKGAWTRTARNEPNNKSPGLRAGAGGSI